MDYFRAACFYQIYPLGLLGAELDNNFDLPPVSRLTRLHEWLPHLRRLGVNALYLCPVFESSRHGYDTRDYMKVDRRLGTNQELAAFIASCHENGIRVVLDGVFNHVGRDFWAFHDVRVNRENSDYADWFHIDFSGNSNYNDGFWYEGWEGHFDLVKLNLHNPAVKNHLFDAVGMWIDDLGIDGLRLDVAYLLSKDFLSELCAYCRNKKSDFWFVGEVLHGDYRLFMDNGLLNSVTNYECYKGLFSSFNAVNLFEIAYALNRQFGNDPWTLYKDRPLFNFVDNHDVNRIASLLNEPRHLPLIYALLFTMPGIPCVYYGSEWGTQGYKFNGDEHLRPQIDLPMWNELSDLISLLAKIRSENRCLTTGGYEQLHLTNAQVIFERSLDNERVIVALNIAPEDHIAHFNANAGQGFDALTGERVDFGGGLCIKAYSAMIICNLG